jgi:outer membrane protein
MFGVSDVHVVVAGWRRAAIVLALVGGGIALLDGGAPLPGSGVARAEDLAEAGPLTIEAAARAALASYPALAVSEAAGDEAHAAVGEVRAAWFPSLRFSATANRSEEPMAVYPIHGFKPGLIPPFDRTYYQGGLNLSYALFDGGARGSRIRQAKERAASTDAAIDATSQSVVARVVVSYLDILSQREIVDAHDRRLAALSAEKRRVEQLLEVGRAAPVERLRVAAAIANAEAERVTYASALGLAEGDLARLIGTDVERTRAGELRAVDLADTLAPDSGRALKQALSQSPALAQARAQAAAAEAATGVARGVRFPSVGLAGNYNGWSDSKGNDQYEWNAAAQVSMPLFTGGAIRSGIARSDAASRGASEQLRLAELQLRQDVDRATTVVADAHARVRSLTSAVASMTEVARIERLALEAGSGTQNDYLDAEANLLVARANLVNAHYREIVARVELARITGQLTPEWLAQNLETRP